jgi:CheY-like chemotaxis protein
MFNSPDAVGKIVLMADDDVRFMGALSKRIRALGFTVIECQDAYMATDLARRHNPDVILLDVNMPAGNGDSTHERLSKIPETAEIPVIYVTGDQSQRVRDRAEQLGAFAIVRKPVDMGDLASHLFLAVRKAA